MQYINNTYLRGKNKMKAIRKKERIRKAVKSALNELVNAGYLKHTKKGWVDSDKVKAMLKEGKSREQIAKILDNEQRLKRNQRRKKQNESKARKT